MRTLILPDADFLSRERSLLSRLEIGLADEGVRVIHALPRSLDPVAAGSSNDQHQALYSTSVTYPDDGLPLTLSLRAAAMIRALERVNDEEGGKSVFAATSARAIDVVHCFGEASMRFGLALARGCGASAIIELWSKNHVQSASKAIRRSGLGGRALALAPDEKLLAHAQQILGPRRVAAAPWGVRSGEGHRKARQPDRPVAAVLIASTDPLASANETTRDHVRQALQGLRAFVDAPPIAPGFANELILFVDAAAARALPLMRWAQELNLAPSLTVIPALEARRDLLVQADVLLIPQALGEHRSFVLDAMAAEMPVIARADPLVDAIDESTGVLTVNSTSADASQAWLTHILAVAKPDETLAKRLVIAHEYTARRCRSYLHPQSVVKAYAQIADANNELRGFAPTPPSPPTSTAGGAS